MRQHPFFFLKLEQENTCLSFFIIYHFIVNQSHFCLFKQWFEPLVILSQPFLFKTRCIVVMRCFKYIYYFYYYFTLFEPFLLNVNSCCKLIVFFLMSKWCTFYSLVVKKTKCNFFLINDAQKVLFKFCCTCDSLCLIFSIVSAIVINLTCLYKNLLFWQR